MRSCEKIEFGFAYNCWRGRQQRRLAMVGVLANHYQQEKKLTESFLGSF
jgi:hypothetical protein